MDEVVALHTQRLAEPAASRYLELLARGIRSGRLNKTFPDRRGLDGTLAGLGAQAHQGLYDSIFLDSRSGLPNMASFTRVLADKSVGLESLPQMPPQAQLDAQRSQAEVWDRMARKRRYYERLGALDLAPVDEHKVLLRRHEPEQSRASFRVELTKLAVSGTYLRLVIELTQTAGLWAQKVVDLDPRGEVASGTEGLRGMVYRFATYDAETLFVRLHELDGVAVERVQRGIVGPVLFRVPADGGAVDVAEPPDDALTEAWRGALSGVPAEAPLIVASFASDVAAADVREERSNDPLAPLLSAGVRPEEQARYRLLRERYPFRVYKDRKFTASGPLVPAIRSMCTAAGTRNIVYPV